MVDQDQFPRVTRTEAAVWTREGWDHPGRVSNRSGSNVRKANHNNADVTGVAPYGWIGYPHVTSPLLLGISLLVSACLKRRMEAKQRSPYEIPIQSNSS